MLFYNMYKYYFLENNNIIFYFMDIYIDLINNLDIYYEK